MDVSAFIATGNGMLIVANKHDNFMKTLRDIGEGKRPPFAELIDRMHNSVLKIKTVIFSL